jgi:hypothetical protein
MTCERWSGDNSEGSGHDQTKVLSWHFLGGKEENHFYSHLKSVFNKIFNMTKYSSMCSWPSNKIKDGKIQDSSVSKNGTKEYYCNWIKLNNYERLRK